MPEMKIEVTYEVDGVRITEPIECEGAMIISKRFKTLMKPQIMIKKTSENSPLFGYFYFNFPEMEKIMVRHALHGEPDIAPVSPLQPHERGIIIDFQNYVGNN